MGTKSLDYKPSRLKIKTYSTIIHWAWEFFCCSYIRVHDRNSKHKNTLGLGVSVFSFNPFLFCFLFSFSTGRMYDKFYSKIEVFLLVLIQKEIKQFTLKYLKDIQKCRIQIKLESIIIYTCVENSNMFKNFNSLFRMFW